MSDTPSTGAERRLAELEAAGVRLGLESMAAVLRKLGEPHRRVPHALVAGTNGKGSTAALLVSMLAAAGVRTGLYTSPHLESPTERIRLDGLAISDARLERALERVLAAAAAAGRRPPTYFEALTLAAFDNFAAEGVEMAVFEVGLGGRLDATNVGEPLLAVITAVGLDHQEFLGRDLGSIAREKAGVMRSGRPAVVGAHAREAREAIAAVGRKLGAQLHELLEQVGWSGDAGSRVLTTPEASYRLTTSLAGRHQEANLAAAVRAAELLLPELGLPLTTAPIETGARACRWPGRLETVALPEGGPVLLDAAHNPQSAEALAAYLGDGFEAGRAAATLLFGVLGDKDVAGMLPPLCRQVDRVVLTAPPGGRAVDPHTLVPLALPGSTEVITDPVAALEAALAHGGPVVACGSIYLVGAVRRALTRRFGTPTPAAGIDVTGR